MDEDVLPRRRDLQGEDAFDVLRRRAPSVRCLVAESALRGSPSADPRLLEAFDERHATGDDASSRPGAVCPPARGEPRPEVPERRSPLAAVAGRFRIPRPASIRRCHSGSARRAPADRPSGRADRAPGGARSLALRGLSCPARGVLEPLDGALRRFRPGAHGSRARRGGESLYRELHFHHGPLAPWWARSSIGSPDGLSRPGRRSPPPSPSPPSSPFAASAGAGCRGWRTQARSPPLSRSPSPSFCGPGGWLFPVQLRHGDRVGR